VYLGGKKKKKLSVIRSGAAWFWERPLTLQRMRRDRVFRSGENMFQAEPGPLPQQFSFALGQINGSV